MAKTKNRLFSLYDVEQFLKDAGAEKVSEKAVVSLEKELQKTVTGLVEEATMYANYAGRTKTINASDVHLTQHNKGASKRYITYKGKRVRQARKGPIIKRSSAMKESVDFSAISGIVAMQNL